MEYKCRVRTVRTWIIAGLIGILAILCHANLILADQPARKVRVAAISFVPKKFGLPENVQRLETMFRGAAQLGAELAVAPEGILEGYVVNEIIAGQVRPEQMRTVAITIDDPIIGRFRDLARELNLNLVFGFAEKIDGDVFNCAVFIDHTGKICGKYHKMQLAEGYSPTWWFNRLGSSNRAFETPLGRCGILICNDRWNADIAKISKLDGAQFFVIPSYGSRSKEQDEAVLNRARENSVPIVEANVGVSLVVSQQKIVAVDRREEGITISQIEIPPASGADPIARDVLEQQFLKWRNLEMDLRYIRRMDNTRRSK